MNGGFKNVAARFNDVDATFERLESKIDQILEVVHGTQLKVEEQARNNSILFDYLHLHQQQHDRIDSSIEDLRNTVHWLATKNPIKP